MCNHYLNTKAPTPLAGQIEKNSIFYVFWQIGCMFLPPLWKFLPSPGKSLPWHSEMFIKISPKGTLSYFNRKLCMQELFFKVKTSLFKQTKWIIWIKINPEINFYNHDIIFSCSLEKHLMIRHFVFERKLSIQRILLLNEMKWMLKLNWQEPEVSELCPPEIAQPWCDDSFWHSQLHCFRSYSWHLK